MTAIPTRGRSSRWALPFAVYLLTAGTFLMGTSEYVIAGLLPEMANDFHVTVSRAGLAITIFAVGVIIGSPATALLTLRLPRRLALVGALVIFAIGHVVAALSPDFVVLLIARVCHGDGHRGVLGHRFRHRLSHRRRCGCSPRAIGVVLGGGMIATAIGVLPWRVRRPTNRLAWTVLATGRPRPARRPGHRPVHTRRPTGH